MSDGRVNIARAMGFGPVADTIVPASSPSAPAQFCAPPAAAKSNAKTRKLTKREERGVSMPGIRKLIIKWLRKLLRGLMGDLMGEL